MFQEECEETHENERGKRPVTRGTRWRRLQETRKKAHQRTHWEPIIKRMREPSVNERGYRGGLTRPHGEVAGLG